MTQNLKTRKIYNYIGNDLRKRYKELMDVESYKEIKGFIQNEYIRIADILPIWNNIRIVYMNELGAMAGGSRIKAKVYINSHLIIKGG